MKILIVDDSIDKISQIESVLKKSIKEPYETESAQSIQNAISVLKTTKFDLIIVDLVLPLRIGENPQPDGGNNFVSEIYRKKSILNVPSYIIGLTKHSEYSNLLSHPWKVLKYDVSLSEWTNDLMQLINHISIIRTQHPYAEISTNKILPTIYVEGETDRLYLLEAINLFLPNISDKLVVKTQKNAGANWVGSQIISWGMQMPKDTNNNYIKSIGLLDADQAGNKSKNDVIRILDTSNKSRTFKIFQIQAKYNKELIAYYSQKCKIEMDIESLFPLDILNTAEENQWLENRSTLFVENPTDWDYFNTSGLDYLKSKSITPEQLIYTKKVKMCCKEKMQKHISANTNQHHVFGNFKLLVEEIKNYLFE